MQKKTTSSQIPLLLLVVLLIYVGQMMINTIIAPLARAVNLAEWHIGATVSVAAFMLMVAGPFWGKRSQSWGGKRVLQIAFSLGIVTTALFALIAWFGMSGAIAGTGLFILFVALRGVGFGLSIAAVTPTAQAYIANATTTEAARVKAMAGIGAMQGIAMILGAALGGALAMRGLMTPLLVVPVILSAALLLVTLRLRREDKRRRIEQPAQISIRDPRVWPFLVAGLGLLTSLGFIQIVAGFLAQDRLALGPEQAGFTTGMLLLSCGLGFVVAQAVIVPKSKWSPVTLLRVGASIATIAFCTLLVDGGLPLLAVSLVLVGIGIGIAMPGYTAGPTLAVSREEQGGLAGLSTATAGAAFIISPVTSTALYGLWQPLPLIIGALMMAFVVVFMCTYRGFRQAG